MDELGSLFNKDALIHALISKSLPPTLAHIMALKHVQVRLPHARHFVGGVPASCHACITALKHVQL